MEEIRLQKYIAECGITSRRKAEDLILKGKVRVNGQVIKELGTKVSGNDVVEVNGAIIHSDVTKKYYLLNKYSTSQFDNEYSYFLDILKKKDTYTIEHKENPAYNYLTYDKLKLENVFTNYVLKDQDQNNLVEYQLYENDKVISSVMFFFLIPITIRAF